MGVGGRSRMSETSYEAFMRREAKIGTTAFQRFCVRRARLKRKLECGHWIDGSEPYRYGVWKHYGDDRIWQRTDCEECARVDARY